MSASIAVETNATVRHRLAARVNVNPPRRTSTTVASAAMYATQEPIVSLVHARLRSILATALVTVQHKLAAQVSVSPPRQTSTTVANVAMCAAQEPIVSLGHARPRSTPATVLATSETPAARESADRF